MGYLDSSPRYLVQAHLVVDECYDAQVRDCGMWHASTAITRSSVGGNVQGFSVIDTHIEGVKTGIFHQHGTTTAGEDPDGRSRRADARRHRHAPSTA